MDADDGVGRERPAGDELAGGVDLHPGRVVHGDHAGGVEVKDLAELLRDLEHPAAVATREGGVGAHAHELLGIGLDVAALRDRQAHGRGAQEVRDERKSFPVPCVQVGARPRGHGELDELEGDLRFHGDVHGGELGVEPADGDGVEPGMLADADLDGELLHGAKGAP